MLPAQQRGTVEQHGHLNHQLVGLASSDVGEVITGIPSEEVGSQIDRVQVSINPPEREYTGAPL